MKLLINTTKNPHRFEVPQGDKKDKKYVEVYLGIAGDTRMSEGGVDTGEPAERVKVDDAIYKELRTQKIFQALLDAGHIIEGVA